MPPSRPRTYRSYLLRCWHTRGDSEGKRFVVETVSGRSQHWGFDSFETLVVFLREELRVGAAEADEGQGDVP